MELSRALRGPFSVARDLKHRVGRVVRRFRDQAHFQCASENEFLGALGGRFGTFGEVLAAAARENHRLFVLDMSRTEAADLFRTRHPDRRDDILREADRICAHRFDVLGSGPLDLGETLPWHTDFKSGRQWDRG